MATVREALGKHNMVPALDFDTTGVIDIPVFKKDQDFKIPDIKIDPEYNPFTGDVSGMHKDHSSFHRETIRNWEKLYEGLSRTEKDSDQYSQQQIEQGRETIPGRLLQFKNRYILVPVKSGLLTVDQKRAHEKILFEKYLDSLNNNNGLAQQDLFPATIELSASDHAVLMEILDDLVQLGFDIRDIGNHNIIVNGYPADADSVEPKSMIECFLEEYKECESDIKIKARERLALSLARASSISWQRTLTDGEMRDLIDNLFACDNPGQLPDGKIVFTIFASEEIERKFKT
jgi:DNA mismatch repair protein MutL